jgi:hypothetical protein
MEFRLKERLASGGAIPGTPNKVVALFDGDAWAVLLRERSLALTARTDAAQVTKSVT